MASDPPAEHAIEALLFEKRTFPPSPELIVDAAITDRSLYEQAEADPEGFWAEQAESLSWIKKWDHVLEWEPPFAKWFEGGQLNISYNCLDRHV